MGQYESTCCPLCKNDSSEPTKYSEGALKIVRCQNCRLWYLSPRLTEDAMLEHYMKADYFEGGDSGYDSYAAQEESLRMTFRRLLGEMSKRGMCGGSVLDIGCGYGYFLQEAEGYFRQRYGTDYSAGALAQAKWFVDKVYQGGIDDVPEEEQFDCVVAFHVIEHVYDPTTFVNSLYRRLKPGGTMILAAPDMGSWWRPLMGLKWPSLKYPEHVVYYDNKTLKLLMETVPLESHQSMPYPHAFPLNLVFNKLRLPEFPEFGKRAVWMPATTVAIAAKKPLAEEVRVAA
ncbi:class I SAM-dependent methyltransferase [Rhodopirellula sp. MGV]|uniref:class I SAM-dependent methyltransferase n=1 Tax=Rhodopirellula sp. MGV TaxID=2023130 RepID=UPI000B975D71|nr:class I SAM-dependent methyltransferase [Rhodopirellula sp. MGV]OYP38919.1 hypothetical protein CGZ80_01485 [Rhodopirellula sp. MGV]PNY37597.1 class I SAM-dependent methyltransferase [Rhodopirellula baltica]